MLGQREEAQRAERLVALTFSWSSPSPAQKKCKGWDFFMGPRASPAPSPSVISESKILAPAFGSACAGGLLVPLRGR